MMDKLLSHLRKSLGKRKPTEVGEIIGDGISIKGITNEAKDEMEKWVNVSLLCLNDCQLETLDNLPKLMLLEEIQLTDNCLSGKDIDKLFIYPHLSIVKLCNNNKINSIEDLRPFENLSEVIYLDLSDCPVSKCDDYRRKVFEMIPTLKHLDTIDKEGNCCSEIDLKSIEDKEKLKKDNNEDGDKDEEDDDGEEELDEEEDDDDENSHTDSDNEEEEEKNTISEGEDVIIKKRRHKKE